MNRLHSNVVAALAALFLAAAFLADDAGAQQKTLKEQLVGTWLFVSTTVHGEDHGRVAGCPS